MTTASPVLPGRTRRWRVGSVPSLTPRTRMYLGLAFLATMLLLGLIMPLPHDPTMPDVSARNLAPSTEHWLGTDSNGIDVLSRTLAAATVDIPIAVGGAGLSLLVGVPIGLFASRGGVRGEAIMRVLDMLQALPTLVIALSIVVLSGGGLRSLMIAVVLVNVPQFIRLVRAEGRVVRSMRFVEVSRAVGAGPMRIDLQHVLPNVWGVALAQLALTAALAIILVSGLGFLGAGVQPPAASWGQILQSGAGGLATGRWWVVTAPSIAILGTVLSFNAIAGGLRAWLDPLA